MAEVKHPMTTAYKAVFLFSIVMGFLCLLGGIASHSKGGLGVLLWGYTAWLMYGRKNSTLVSLFKILMWFQIIGGGIGLMFMLSLEINDLVGVGLIAYAAMVIIGASISYGLLSFFQKQGAVTSTKTLDEEASLNPLISKELESKYWEQALSEFNSDARNKSLWAKLFAECDGDENKTQAKYLSIRFTELAHKNTPPQQDLRKQTKSAPAKGGYGVFFGILLMVGLVVLLIFNLSGTGNISSYFMNRTSATKFSSDPLAPKENSSSKSTGGWYPIFFDGQSTKDIQKIVSATKTGEVSSLQIQYDKNIQLAKWVAQQIEMQTTFSPMLWQRSPPDSNTVVYERNRVTVIVNLK